MILDGRTRHLQCIRFVLDEQQTSETFSRVFHERQSGSGTKSNDAVQANDGTLSGNVTSQLPRAMQSYVTAKRVRRLKQPVVVSSDGESSAYNQLAHSSLTSAPDAEHLNVDDVPSAPSATTSASQDTCEDEDCVICMCPVTDPKALLCGHKFCTDCIDQYFDKCQPKCPSCGRLYGVMRGNQPPGTMNVRVVRQNLAGYESFNTIKIEYDIPDGIQTVGTIY